MIQLTHAHENIVIGSAAMTDKAMKRNGKLGELRAEAPIMRPGMTVASGYGEMSDGTPDTPDSEPDANTVAHKIIVERFSLARRITLG